MRKTITFRPTEANETKIEKYLKKEKDRRGLTSINNTIEQIILEHKMSSTSKIIVNHHHTSRNL